MTNTTKRSARTKLLDATLDLVRANGFAATSVDQICRQAGVTKGAFFHHFDSKDALGVAAAAHWSETTGALFDAADYHRLEDPAERLFAYLDLRKSLITGEPAEFACFAGTMIQEAHASSPGIREACHASIFGHAETLEADIEAAVRARNLSPDWSAHSLALHVQGVLQGAFILAKASGDRAVAHDMIDHLARYLRCLFAVTDDAGLDLRT